VHQHVDCLELPVVELCVVVADEGAQDVDGEGAGVGGGETWLFGHGSSLPVAPVAILCAAGGSRQLQGSDPLGRSGGGVRPAALTIGCGELQWRGFTMIPEINIWAV